MADAAIFDLTAETALTAAHEFVTQDTSAATRAQAATFALMGGLVYSASSADANVSATVGTLHAIDISGFTADRNFILPDSAQLGERVGVFLTVGDASFELDIVTAATGSQINGVNAGVTSWSRVFITNECVTFRCIAAGGAGATHWIVEYDGRIPCHCKLYSAADITNHFTGATWITAAFDTELFDIGDIGNLSNESIDVRRAGQYHVTGFGFVSDQADGGAVSVRIVDGAGTPNRLMFGLFTKLGAAGTAANPVAGPLTFSAGNIGTTAAQIKLQLNAGATGDEVGDVFGTFLVAQEVLSR